MIILVTRMSRVAFYMKQIYFQIDGDYQKATQMKSLAKFDLRFKSDGSKKIMPVEILVDNESTFVILDCKCCKDIISRRLPGGVLIPISSTLKTFFENNSMRNISVNVSKHIMTRTYRGVIDSALIPEMQKLLEKRVSQFSKKRKL